MNRVRALVLTCCPLIGSAAMPAGTGVNGEARPPATSQKDAPPTFQLAPLPGYVVDGTSLAMRTLASGAAPFSGALQTLDHLREVTLLLAFLRQDDAPKVQLPEVCGVWRAPLRLCELAGQRCAVIQPGAPDVVVCNYDFFVQLDYLMRVNHDTKALRAALRSDRSFMDLLSAISPGGTKPPPKIEVPYDHLVEHWFGLTAFILHHEAYHLGASSGSSPERPSTRRQANVPGERGALDQKLLEEELYCRMYREFQRQGWTLSQKSTPVRIDEEHRDVSGATGDVLQLSLAEWTAERRADAQAVRAVLDVLTRIAESNSGGLAMRDRLVDEMIRDFGMIALMSWYSRVARFIDIVCPEVRAERFPLTRCMCAHKSRFDDARILMDENHPPVLLRMRTVIERLLLARRDPAQSGAIAFYQVTTGLLDAPLKIAHLQCTLAQIDRALTPTAQIFQLYPAIEALAESGQGEREALGYPTYDESAKLQSACLARP